MDDRLKLLSYSSLLILHSCARKFQLYRLNILEDEDDPESSCNQNITFAFGHVVGQGVQDVMEGRSIEDIYMRALIGWHADLIDEDTKRNKSFWLALSAIERFISMRESGFLDDYELLYYNGKPAVELSFRIKFANSFYLRGSVDAVLRNKRTGKVIVLECKTSSSTSLNPAQFKNSSQAIGYSVVLDVVCPGINSYDVDYIVYMTKSMSWELLAFSKTYLQRALWIQEILLDIKTIEMYDEVGVFPMRGESCYDFGRTCEYMSVCTLSTAHLTKTMTDQTKVKIDNKVYDVELNVEDIINAQLNAASITQTVEAVVNENNTGIFIGDELL